MMITILDAGGRVLVKASAAHIELAGRVAQHNGAARIYAGVVYAARPWSREAWRALDAARHAMRAEIAFLPFFA